MVLIHLCQLNITLDKVVDKLDLHYLVNFADCHDDFFFGEYKTFQAFNLMDYPCAVRYFGKRKTTVLRGYGSRNGCSLCKFRSASLKDIDCRTAQSLAVLV